MQEFREFLERMDSAVVQRDWTSYRPLIDLPFVLVDSRATKVFLDEIALRSFFDVSTSIFGVGSNREIMRLASGVVMLEPTLMHGTFESHVFDRGHRCAAPFLSTMLLRQVDDAWRMTLLTSRVGQLKWSDAITMNLMSPVGSAHSN